MNRLIETDYIKRKIDYKAHTRREACTFVER